MLHLLLGRMSRATTSCFLIGSRNTSVVGVRHSTVSLVSPCPGTTSQFSCDTVTSSSADQALFS